MKIIVFCNKCILFTPTLSVLSSLIMFKEVFNYIHISEFTPNSRYLLAKPEMAASKTDITAHSLRLEGLLCFKPT